MEEGRGRERWVPASRVLVPWYYPGPRSTVGVFPLSVSVQAACLSSSETKANNSNAHLASYKCAGHILPDHFYRITETNLLAGFTLGFLTHTVGFTIT